MWLLLPWAPLFEIHGNMVRKLTILVRNSSNTEVIPIGSEKWRPLGVTRPPKDEIHIVS